MNILVAAREKLGELAHQHNLLLSPVQIVSARSLSPTEAIGSPERNDYPLLTGKEVMMEARFGHGIGQAFTDQAGHFSGSLENVLQLPLTTNFERAVFISTLNAVLHSLSQIEGTRHCRDQEPARCARRLPEYLEQNYGQPKIAFIGFQPAFIEGLHNAGFALKVTDLNPDNIGQIRCGVPIYSAERNAEHVQWADIVLATGSVLVNNTYQELQQGKPVLYYGVTIVGLAKLFDLKQICFYSW